MKILAVVLPLVLSTCAHTRGTDAHRVRYVEDDLIDAALLCEPEPLVCPTVSLFTLTIREGDLAIPAAPRSKQKFRRPTGDLEYLTDASADTLTHKAPPTVGLDLTV